MMTELKKLSIPPQDGILLDAKVAHYFRLNDYPLVYMVPGGEQVKSVDWWQRISEYFLSKNISRSFHLWVIGGGATTDVGGFVAATLLRGVAWSAVPTTLLAQVDASIGGKTAINSKFGKNLIGAFHKPSNVYLCPEFFQSLQEHQMRSGRGEILKYALLESSIKQLVLEHAPLEKIIQACFEFKKRVTERDFLERGERIKLNLGHTLGHIIESKYRLEHGLAVAEGLFWEAKLFYPDLLPEIKILADKLDLDFGDYPLDREDLQQWGVKDKKTLESGQLTFVVPQPPDSYSLVRKNVFDIRL